MIKITFTCDGCAGVAELPEEDDIEEKRCVPVCDACYAKFMKRKETLKHDLKKLYEKYHIDCPVMDF